MQQMAPRVNEERTQTYLLKETTFIDGAIWYTPKLVKQKYDNESVFLLKETTSWLLDEWLL